jgi:hypothetical protein
LQISYCKNENLPAACQNRRVGANARVMRASGRRFIATDFVTGGLDLAKAMPKQSTPADAAGNAWGNS